MELIVRETDKERERKRKKMWSVVLFFNILSLASTVPDYLLMICYQGINS
jgi:hypothetical protein